ncbi:MAG TPA: hypothetical protein VGL16_12640 [Actinomycetota bacterium]
MRRWIISGTVALAMVLPWANPAQAEVSPTQHLSPAACNEGTMNAHENIPEATGTGTTTPGHFAVPGTGNVTPCGHGG